MAQSRNQALAAWLDQNELEVPDLVELLNDTVGEITGVRGKTTERTVFRWLFGENRWPRLAQRLALEAITGHSPIALGFVRPDRRATQQEESSVHRRTFMTAGTGTALAVSVPRAAARPTVGFAEVRELRGELADLWREDDTTGGSAHLESRA